LKGSLPSGPLSHYEENAQATKIKNLVYSQKEGRAGLFKRAGQQRSSRSIVICAQVTRLMPAGHQAVPFVSHMRHWPWVPSVERLTHWPS